MHEIPMVERCRRISHQFPATNREPQRPEARSYGCRTTVVDLDILNPTANHHTDTLTLCDVWILMTTQKLPSSKEPVLPLKQTVHSTGYTNINVRSSIRNITGTLFFINVAISSGRHALLRVHTLWNSFTQFCKGKKCHCASTKWSWG